MSSASSALETDHLSLRFELFPHRSLTCLAFAEVKNCLHIKELVSSKQLDVALLGVSSAPNVACIHIAANKALFAADTLGKTSAASLHAELVYCLHGGRNVGEALRALGPDECESDVLLCCFDASVEMVTRLCTLVQGARVLDVAEFLETRARRARDEPTLVLPVSHGGISVDSIIGRTASQGLR